jgi:hypothetical protein
MVVLDETVGARKAYSEEANNYKIWSEYKYLIAVSDLTYSVFPSFVSCLIHGNSDMTP